MALITLGGLLRLSQSTALFADLSQTRLWLVFGLYVIFSLGFGLSAYGLWQHHNWGRLLFLWSIGLWSVFGLVGLFVANLSPDPQRIYTLGGILFNIFRYLVTFLLPFLYLNLAHIKHRFQN